MNDSKELIKRSYDLQAPIYANRKLLQTSNLKRLVSHLHDSTHVPSKGVLLDIGCGDGVLLDVLRERYRRQPFGYIGVDLSDGMIAAALERHAGEGEFQVGDAEHLPLKSNSVDLVISNSVLHWLNVVEEMRTPENAVGEIYRVLSPGGIAAVSVSAIGTAARFLLAYKKSLRAALNSEASVYGDPIGSMQLHDLVNIFLRCNFSIDLAQLEYEPAVYPEPKKYADDVKAYGYEMFLRGVPIDQKEKVWETIVKEFESICGLGKYVHDQYMSYVIVRKPLGGEK